MKVRFLGTHNAVSKHSNLSCFLVDNIIAVDAGSLASELTFQEQSKIKAILLSHGHYDHIRELPAFAFNNQSHVTKVFGMPDTLQIFSSHLADGLIYPEFFSANSYLAKSILDMVEVQPLQPFEVFGYRILPVLVPHSIPAVGFEIKRGAKRLFYTGDTGSGLASAWQNVSPQLLITELTLPDRLSNVARDAGHLSAGMLKAELVEFQRIRGYLPKVKLVHYSPQLETEIEQDLKEAFKDLPVSISLAREGEEINI